MHNTFHVQNQFSDEKKSILMIRKEKNQHTTSFRNKKISTQQKQKSTNKISLIRRKHQCTGFKKRKINMQEISGNKNQHVTSSTNERSVHERNTFSTNERSVHERNTFHYEKNQFRNFTKRKIHMQNISRTKPERNRLHEEKSIYNKFHEQNQFNDDKNQCRSFTNKKSTSYKLNQKISKNKSHEQNSVCNRLDLGSVMLVTVPQT